jgi:hypothetical protein
VQGLLLGGNPFRTLLFLRIAHGSKEPKQGSLPDAFAWIAPSFQRSGLGPCNSPQQGFFSRSFVLDCNQTPHPSYQRSRLHCFLRPIFPVTRSISFSFFLFTQLLPVNPPSPVAVLPRFLTFLTRVIVPDNCGSWLFANLPMWALFWLMKST